MNNNEIFKIENKLKKILLILNGFLVLGLLGSSIIFFILNKVLNPADIASNLSAVELRFFWRDFAGTMYTVCKLIYIVGHIVVISTAMINRITFSFKILVSYYLLQIVIMFLCVVPIALLDSTYFTNYIFPLWSLIITLVLLFIISILTTAHKS